jgi:hypothetical protein
MFVKPQTREDLQIQMNILKGNHLMLKTRFNKYFEGMKIKNSQDYTDLIHSLRELYIWLHIGVTTPGPENYYCGIFTRGYQGFEYCTIASLITTREMHLNENG